MIKIKRYFVGVRSTVSACHIAWRERINICLDKKDSNFNLFVITKNENWIQPAGKVCDGERCYKNKMFHRKINKPVSDQNNYMSGKGLQTKCGRGRHKGQFS